MKAYYVIYIERIDIADPYQKNDPNIECILVERIANESQYNNNLYDLNLLMSKELIAFIEHVSEVYQKMDDSLPDKYLKFSLSSNEEGFVFCQENGTLIWKPGNMLSGLLPQGVRYGIYCPLLTYYNEFSIFTLNAIMESLVDTTFYKQ